MTFKFKVFTSLSIEEIHTTLDYLPTSGTPWISLIVTANHHSVFSVGLDWKNVLKMTVGGIKAYTYSFHQLCSRILSLPYPTLISIQGHCYAGGCIFSFSFDFRFMTTSPKARFCMSEAAIGIGPYVSIGNIAPVMQKLRPSIVKYMVMYSRPFSAKESLENWIVDRIVDGDQLLEESVGFFKEFMTRVCVNNDNGYAAIKEVANKKTLEAIRRNWLHQPASLISRL